MVKVTDMIKIAMTHFRNILSKIEVVIKGDSQDTCWRNSVLSAFNFNLLSVFQWKILWRQSLSWLRAQFVSGVAKEM